MVTLAVRSLPSSSIIWLAEVSKFSSYPCSSARAQRLGVLKTERRKENSEAAKLADFGSCVLDSLLSVKVCLGLVIFCVLLMRKSRRTVSNSPGALCRISSSVADLMPGERTSAPPRSVLQVSDCHLRRYPLHIPLFLDHHLSLDQGPPRVNPIPSRSLLCFLLYSCKF